MKIALRLAGIRLAQPAGEPIDLASLWREKPVVIAWVRHFG